MSIYDDIRSCLETELSNTAGLPDLVYENTHYEPTTGTPFVTCSLIPTYRAPAVRFTNPQQLYLGVFRLMVHTPENTGPGAADDYADILVSAFDATTDISSAGTIVSIEKAERRMGYVESPWYIVPVEVDWYIYN